jgi:thiol-disulfide isomerase/thioredoxin
MSRTLSLRLLVSALALALLAACGGKALGSEATGKAGFKSATGYNVTDIAPADRDRKPVFSGTDFQGKRISQGSLRGSVAVVNFWASWCGPCRREERNLEDLWQRYGPRGVEFLGVNTRDTKIDARSFLEEFDVTYRSIFDPYAKIAYKFRVVYLPVTYVLDKQGRIAAIIVGATEDTAAIERILERELAA